ncbi:Proline iminopeptidase [Poriferisphaera corsica]|uniref:Proline iminopeptidase n=1 Tax=Poriferisphaera corsica TaxID=2528020 RepID=A0A517YR80_9BACT|nr:alpha/beta hydrolase [Poriferisphaera corsica]QDU32732.1 Proline iminopeptidase [Poriferisphaera corsica]
MYRKVELMQMNRKKWVIKFGVMLIGMVMLLGVGGFWYVSWLMKQPMYEVGDARDERLLRGPLRPPIQTGEAGVWLVEPDVKLAFDVYGEGEDVLVVHGGPGMPYGKLWDGLEALTDRYRFYFYDQRGAGRSTRLFDRFEGNYYENMVRLEQGLGLGAQVADIERARQILGQEQITVIGHSYGGFVAMLYAAEFPEHVKKLVLVAPADVLLPWDEKEGDDLFEGTREKLSEGDRVVFDRLMSEYFNFAGIFERSDEELATIHVGVGKYLLKGLGADHVEMNDAVKSGGWSVFAVYFSQGQAGDYREALEQVKARTLIVHGADDVMARRGSEHYREIEGSEFVVISGEKDGGTAGHFVYDEQAKKFGEVVGAFLDEE